MTNFLSVLSASSLLCVTITKVWLYLSLKSKKSWCSASAFLESKFPVGSSAKIIFGELIKALATHAALHHQKVLLVYVEFYAQCVILSNKRNALSIDSFSFFPEILVGISTFSKAVNSGNNWWCWNTNPMFSFLNLEISLSFIFRNDWSPIVNSVPYLSI